MKTFASIFSGGELAGIGTMAAGLTPIWGVECDSDIASVAEMNTNSKVIVDYAQNVDYSRLESPYWLHMSPPCVNASVAKSDARETEVDKEMARACARAILALRPSCISLENVWNYRTFESFQIIVNQLALSGYHFRFWHLNAADYGVPQTRKRLILVACLEASPRKPIPTHRPASYEAQTLFFGRLPAWVGWYEAIEDLIPSLPESKFADWQLARLPETLQGSCLAAVQGEASDIKKQGEPSPVVTTAHSAGKYRAFIAHPNADNDWFVTRDASEPVFTLKANGNGTPRAFIADSRNTNKAVLQRDKEQPAFTVTVNDRPSHFPRAFIVSCHQSDTSIPKCPIRYEDEPTVTVNTHSSGHSRAWLEHGRVVSMTPRALARFQSIPDPYRLPEKNSLACRVIGNAVPPLLMQRIIEAQHFIFAPT